MAQSIASSNIGRVIGGYGGASGSSNVAGILSNLRGTELSNQLNTKRYEDAFGLQEREFDEKVSQFEQTFADSQKRYQDTMSKWGFDVGGGTRTEREDYFEGTTGFSELPEGDPALNNTGWGGIGRGLAGRGGGGNYVNSTVDLSDPGKALSAANYARSLGDYTQRISPMTRNPYHDIEQRILNSLSGGRRIGRG